MSFGETVLLKCIWELGFAAITSLTISEGIYIYIYIFAAIAYLFYVQSSHMKHSMCVQCQGSVWFISDTFILFLQKSK
jgi:hypothetical protein